VQLKYVEEIHRKGAPEPELDELPDSDENDAHGHCVIGRLLNPVNSLFLRKPQVSE
jgi:hypothetical protein